MIVSFVIKNENRYNLRWVFGIGLSLFLTSITTFSFNNQRQYSQYNFDINNQYYVGTILNIPEIKPNSIAYNINLTHPLNKKVLLYLEKNNEARQLKPGNEIVFKASIKPFRNKGNPDDIDYANYMSLKGFSGTAFVASDNWKTTGVNNYSVQIVSQRFRAAALDFYKKLGFDYDSYTFISALTLGYKSNLSENMQEAFRATGTAHVLAVSGLHVGVIYLVINFMFSFLGTRNKAYIIRQIIIISILWWYVFVAGMSASIVRAAIMLSINCIGKMLGQKGFTFNTLAIAAFFSLIFKPLSLYDISFQMSFGAVFAILYFQPKLTKLYSSKNRLGKKLWDMFAVSLSAQLGVFPLVLYYFGTFPVYFFIANLIIVPLIGLIIYLLTPLIAISLLSSLQLQIFDLIQNLLYTITQFIINLTLRTVYIIETLPFVQITDSYLTLLQLVLLLTFIYIISHVVFNRRPQHLVSSLTLVLIFLMSITFNKANESTPEIVIFNNYNKSEIAAYYKNKRHFINIPANGLIAHPNKSILRLSKQPSGNTISSNPFPLDYLILSEDNAFIIEELLLLFQPQIIIIDSSVPAYSAKTIKNDCEVLSIVVHDVKENGAYSLNF